MANGESSINTEKQVKDIIWKFWKVIEKDQKEFKKELEQKLEKPLNDINWTLSSVRWGLGVGGVILFGTIGLLGYLVDFMNDEYQARLQRLESEVFISKTDVFYDHVKNTFSRPEGEKSPMLIKGKEIKHVKGMRQKKVKRKK